MAALLATGRVLKNRDRGLDGIFRDNSACTGVPKQTPARYTHVRTRLFVFRLLSNYQRVHGLISNFIEYFVRAQRFRCNSSRVSSLSACNSFAYEFRFVLNIITSFREIRCTHTHIHIYVDNNITVVTPIPV